MSFGSRLMQKPFWRGNRLVAFGSEQSYYAPEIGDLVVCDATQTHPGKLRRIVSVRVDQREGREVWIVEHVALDADPNTGTDRRSVGFWATVGWPRMPEHYPICGVCHDLMPCNHSVVDRITESSLETFEQFNTPGVCPSCQEPVTARQKSVTFDRNLHGFGQVVFHLRKQCRWDACRYDEDVHREDGDYQLTCPGKSRGGIDEKGMPVTYCSDQNCRGANRKHRRMEFWTASYLPQPDGYYRSPEDGTFQ